MTKLAEIRKSTANYFVQPTAKLLAKTPLTPNSLTWTGFWLTVIAGILIIYHNLLIAGIVVLIAGAFDMLDGALARLTNRATRFGAVLDSTLDRLSEAVIFISLLVFYSRSGAVSGVALVGITMTGSFLVSYLRARMEALGVDGKVGVFTRPERVVVLTLGLLLSQFDYALYIALVIIAVFSFITVAQRLTRAWQQTQVGS